MLLAIDIGNTVTDLGVFDEERLVVAYKTKSAQTLTLDECKAKFSFFITSNNIDPKSIEQIIVSSVVPSLTEISRKVCEEYFDVKPRFVGPGLKTGIKIDCDNPREVGSDIIGDCAGALAKYGYPAIIVDMGTANKVILIDKNGAFAGCTIGAGIGMSHDALVDGTSLLFEVSLATPKKVLGKNTNDCMNSALTYGTAFSIRGLADAIEKEAGYPCKRILTGGNAQYVEKLLGEFEVDRFLLLEGLREIAKLNRK